MSIVKAIEQVRDWAEKNICEGTRLKVPSEYQGNIANSANYEYKEVVTPACFAMFVPSSEKLATDAKPPIPSLCVKLLEGEEYNLRLQLEFSVWNPGNYGKDILIKDPDQRQGVKYRPAEEMENEFTLYADAWRDVWNWVDKGLRVLQNTKSFGKGVTLDLSSPIRYNPYKDQNEIMELFPFWIAQISFYVNLSMSETRFDAALEKYL